MSTALLETLFAPVTRLVNRQIGMQTPARALCEALDGRVIAVRVRDSALVAYCFAENAGIRISGEFAGEPDAVIRGSLFTLATIAGSAGERAVRDGSLQIAGDADVARRFQRLLQYGRPDLEEELSAIVGDAAAHGIGQFARGVGDWGRRARATWRQNLGEYLQEESRALPSRNESEAFRRDVEALRDDVARLEARLERLESAHGRRDDVRR